MSHGETRILSEVPSLSKLYLGAAAGAARSRVLGSSDTSSLPQTRHQVTGVTADLAKLTEFQHLVGRSARDVLPSGYLHALAFPVAMSLMVGPDFPLPLLGMIHLRNRVEHFQPVLFSQPLTITAWAENLAGNRSGTTVDLVAEIRPDGSDVLLWRGVSNYLAKGVYLPGIDKPTAEAPRVSFDPPSPTGMWRLGVDIGREYAAVSGDFNPIHLSALTARALGMRRSIAHGMYLAARLVEGVGEPKPDSFGWDIAFEAPVFLPATVALNIDDVTDEDGTWEHSDYVAWSPITGRRHFSGSVHTLASETGDF